MRFEEEDLYRIVSGIAFGALMYCALAAFGHLN
jgi:hypothetical protein